MYTDIIKGMMDIIDHEMDGERASTMVDFMGISAFLREFRTIRIKGKRQSGHSTTLVEWYMENNSILVTHSRYVHRDMIESLGKKRYNRVDTKNIITDWEKEFPRLIGPNIRYILVDEADHALGKAMTVFYQKLAMSGRYDLIVILM